MESDGAKEGRHRLLEQPPGNTGENPDNNESSWIRAQVTEHLERLFESSVPSPFSYKLSPIKYQVGISISIPIDNISIDNTCFSGELMVKKEKKVGLIKSYAQRTIVKLIGSMQLSGKHLIEGIPESVDVELDLYDEDCNVDDLRLVKDVIQYLEESSNDQT